MKNLFLLLTLLLFNKIEVNAQNISLDTIKYSVSEYGWNKGDKIPNLKLRDVSNKEFMLYEKLDKLTIIDFWFTACKPCTKNKRYLKTFYKQYDIEIISISIDDRASIIKKYVNENNVTWINIHDDSIKNNRFKKRIGYDNGYPDYIVISPEKEIMEIFTSGNDINRLGVLLQKYFK